MNNYDKLILGRGFDVDDVDIRINDISISRYHAFIKLKDDGIYIEDNMSKFGTLVLLKKPLMLN